MDNTNLFKHSPKELVTDAFITWLLYFLDSKENLKKQKIKVFNTLLLKKDDKNKIVDSIKIVKQKKGLHGRPDIVLSFNLNGEKKTILFENKTWTTTSKDQLNRYKKDYNNIYRYLYLKLAYVNIREQKLCENCGYDIITSEHLLETINELKDFHVIIKQYADYLNNAFVDKIKNLHYQLFTQDNFKTLKKAQGQEIFISHLYNALHEKQITDLKFKTGSSFGRPWTELYIYKKKVKYHKEKNAIEIISWRVDTRSSKYYVRLNQYTHKPTKDYLPIKKKRLKKLRNIAKKLIQEDKKLNYGKLSNRGKAQSEIAIFFEDKNSINYLLNILPSLSKKIIEKYEIMNNNL